MTAPTDRASKTPTTLVLIPGLLSDARVWKPLATACPNLPVHHADVTQDDTIEAMAARILRDVSGKCVLVGHSMGGRVAMEVARQAPSRVSKLVLANTGHRPLLPGELEKRQTKIADAYRNFPAMIDAWLPPMVAANRHRDADLISNLTEMALSIGPETHERQIKALIARPNATQYLPNVTCPILLIAGTDDQWSPVSQHEEMRHLAHQATLEVVEGGGHFLPVEQSAVVTRLTCDWIAGE